MRREEVLDGAVVAALRYFAVEGSPASARLLGPGEMGRWRREVLDELVDARRYRDLPLPGDADYDPATDPMARRPTGERGREDVVEKIVSFSPTKYAAADDQREPGVPEPEEEPKEDRPEPSPEPPPEEIGEPEIVVEPDPEPDPEPEEPAVAAASEELRKCVGCGRERPLSEFRSSPRSADGISKKCGDCLDEGRRRSAEATRKHWENVRAQKADSGATEASGEPDAGPESKTGSEPEGEPEGEPEDGTARRTLRQQREAERKEREAEFLADRNAPGDGGDPVEPPAEEDDTGVAEATRRRHLAEESKSAEEKLLDSRIAEFVAEERSKPATSVVETLVARPVRGAQNTRVFCANGDRCAAPGIDGPQPLVSGKEKGDICHFCEENDRRVTLTPDERRRLIKGERRVGA